MFILKLFCLPVNSKKLIPYVSVNNLTISMLLVREAAAPAIVELAVEEKTEHVETKGKKIIS